MKNLTKLKQHYLWELFIRRIIVSYEVNSIITCTRSVYKREGTRGLITNARAGRCKLVARTINTKSGSRVSCVVNSSKETEERERERERSAAAPSRRLRDTARNTQYHFPGTVGDPHFSRGLAVQFHTVVNTLLLFLTSSSILLTLSPCRANFCR